ncbi:MAG: PAS domain S-box protein [Planctomycetota bacterium]
MALQESQEQRHALVETTAQWIWATAKEGTFTYCSPTVGSLSGHEPEEVVGRTPCDFIQPSAVKSFASVVRNSMSHGTPIGRLEHPDLHKDRRRVVLETTAVAVLDGKGYRVTGSAVSCLLMVPVTAVVARLVSFDLAVNGMRLAFGQQFAQLLIIQRLEIASDGQILPQIFRRLNATHQGADR